MFYNGKLEVTDEIETKNNKMGLLPISQDNDNLIMIIPIKKTG